MFPGETILDGEDGSKGLAKVEEKKKDTHVSEFQVLQSAAGWYVGTIWKYDGCEACVKEYGPPELWKNFMEPNSRETDYFSSEADAAQALATFKETGALARMRE